MPTEWENDLYGGGKNSSLGEQRERNQSSQKEDLTKHRIKSEESS